MTDSNQTIALLSKIVDQSRKKLGLALWDLAVWVAPEIRVAQRAMLDAVTAQCAAAAVARVEAERQLQVYRIARRN